MTAQPPERVTQQSYHDTMQAIAIAGSTAIAHVVIAGIHDASVSGTRPDRIRSDAVMAIVGRLAHLLDPLLALRLEIAGEAGPRDDLTITYQGVIVINDMLMAMTNTLKPAASDHPVRRPFLGALDIEETVLSAYMGNVADWSSADAIPWHGPAPITRAVVTGHRRITTAQALDLGLAAAHRLCPNDPTTTPKAPEPGEESKA